MDDINSWLGLLSVLLAVFAIWVTYHTYRQARKDSQTIQKLLATHPLEIFPGYINELAEMIEGAQFRVDVLCAYPQHGAFSSPKCWDRLESAIESTLKKKHISKRFIFSNSEQRIGADFNQFDTADEDWQGWSLANREKLSGYLQDHSSVCKKHGLDKSSPDQALQGFADWLWFQDECEKATIHRWKTFDMDKARNASIFESGDLMPLFAWIVDRDREAIFTFMTYNHHGIGAAFRTTDKRIVDNLFSLVERYERRARPFDGNSISQEKGRDIVNEIGKTMANRMDS